MVGLNEAQVASLVQKAFSPNHPVYITDINAPRQIVIGGSNDGIANVLEMAHRSGARKAELLDVAVPSHCPLLQPVADALERSLRAMDLQPPKRIYVANVTGRALRTADAIAQDIGRNIAHCVRWYDATTVLTELGCRLFLEMPPGQVLSRLAAEAFPEVRTLAIGEASLEDALRVAS